MAMKYQKVIKEEYISNFLMYKVPHQPLYDVRVLPPVPSSSVVDSPWRFNFLSEPPNEKFVRHCEQKFLN